MSAIERPFEPHIPKLSLIPTLLSIALLLTLSRRYYRLSHVPGPFLASLTDAWLTWRIWRGEYLIEIVADLHKTYGPVVRTGPNRVSFARPEAIPEVYGASKVYSKAASYNPMIVLTAGHEVPTFITLRDEKRVTGIKRHISAGFSQTSWLKQESSIDGTIAVLLEQLRRRAGTIVALNTWLSLWAADTLTILAFSQRRGHLEAGYDLDGTGPSARARFEHWRSWALMPELESLIYKNRFVQMFRKRSSPLARLAADRIRDRKAMVEEEEEADDERSLDLLGRYLSASEKVPDAVGPQDVMALTISTINAGSETVAQTVSMALMYALRDVSIFRKLEEEILDAGLESGPARYADVEKLPYLDAVIRETLRFNNSPNTIERIIPSSGDVATICSIPLASGTSISVSRLCTARDPTLFGPTASQFDPSRWLSLFADDHKRREMDMAGMGFSWGRRVCIGQHLARIEMKKVIASLISEFRVESVEVGERGWEGNFRGMDLDVKLVARRAV